ncbi:MAG: hypothetical protein IPM46_02790 [Flavobacteriales bacterium]|nr:hypothetical protein [Flavobacteriales bacterium]
MGGFEARESGFDEFHRVARLVVRWFRVRWLTLASAPGALPVVLAGDFNRQRGLRDLRCAVDKPAVRTAALARQGFWESAGIAALTIPGRAGGYWCSAFAAWMRTAAASFGMHAAPLATPAARHCAQAARSFIQAAWFSILRARMAAAILSFDMRAARIPIAAARFSVHAIGFFIHATRTSKRPVPFCIRAVSFSARAPRAGMQRALA